MSLRSRVADVLRQLPIRRKLDVIVIATVALAVILAGIGIVVADSVLFYGYLQRDLSTFVRIVGDNSTGALAFRDAKAASENLAVLRARTHVESACLFHSDGTELAKYSRPEFSGPCPPPSRDGVRAQDGVLIASYRVMLADQPAGTLVLRYDLGEIYDRIWLYSGTVLLTLLICAAVALLLSSKLRAHIAEPILQLAGAAKAVSQRRDYSIRAAKISHDEVGDLAEAINQMLQGIQSRDEDLQAALAAQRDAAARLAQTNTHLQRSNADLARSYQDLERIAFVSSHDLQEPLRMITTYSQLLIAQYPQKDAEQYVGQIVDGMKRMRELLTDLLTYTEIAGSAEPSPEPVDLNAVMEKVRGTLAHAIQESGAEVTAGPLPVVLAHERRMTSLLQNLLGNAIKYRANRPLRVHVALGHTTSGSPERTVSVSDNGIGIAAEYHQRIFTAFKRLHGREVPGTGIGLAICQRIIERYGGRIWVESEVDRGSTFCFTLPPSMLVGDE